MNFKKLAVLFSAATIGSSLLLRWFNRPQPYYYEYLNPSVILVAIEELDGVDMPASFCWSKDVTNVFFYANPKLSTALTSSWLRYLQPLSISREGTFTSNYSAALREICSLPVGMKAIIISDAKTISKLNRYAVLWSDSPHLLTLQPILKPISSREQYMTM